jgi:hypothetical protein
VRAEAESLREKLRDAIESSSRRRLLEMNISLRGAEFERHQIDVPAIRNGLA